MDQKLIKVGLGIEDKDIVVTKVSNGFNIRIKKPKKIKIHKKNKEEMTVALCRKCGRVTYCHYHHITPISRGGGDEILNKIPLCFEDHVGDNGIHLGKWKIEEVMAQSELNHRKETYGI